MELQEYLTIKQKVLGAQLKAINELLQQFSVSSIMESVTFLNRKLTIRHCDLL